jgi:hypothetical protein
MLKHVEFDLGLPPRERDEPISFQTGALLLVGWLEARGVTLLVDDNGFLHVDLDPLGAALGMERAAEIATVILCLREEIKDVLRARAPRASVVQ